MKREMLTNKEYHRMAEEYDKVRHYCECGHSMIIPAWVEKIPCNWCGRYVFRDKETEQKYRKQEFKNKMKEKMRG